MQPARYPSPSALRGPLLARSPREWLFIGIGIVAILFFLVWRFGGDEVRDAPPVELVPAPPSTVAATATTTVSSFASAPQAASTQGLVLRGVMAQSAIIAFPQGSERTIALNREFLPGLTLRNIAVDHVILGSAAGELRLDLRRFGGATPATVSTTGARVASASAAPAPKGDDSLDYRLGLDPRRVNGRIIGFAVRPGAKLPSLTRAGLRPGDVLIAVNGQAVESVEKMMELPREIAGSYTAEFEFERGGKRMRANLEINKRPG